MAREPLLRSLEAARTGRLTQIVGPPGSGKTAALTQWHDDLRARGVIVAWYTASAREREPAAFLAMVARSLDCAGLSMADTGIFDTRDVDPRAAIDAILLKLDVSAADTVIVVDAFDRIETPRLAACLEELVAAMPETAHIVLATRRRPQLTMALLRAHGFVRTIESRELLLNVAEIAELLQLPRDSLDVAAIAEQTGGWAVAVELYRVWRARTGRRTTPAPPFSSQVSEVADYLTEEVFATLDADHQRLLVELSLLDSITPEAADWMRGRSDSAQLLAAIWSALPGLVERDSDDLEPAYRLHPLLADYARARLQTSVEDRSALYRKAASWYAARRRYVEAVSYARAADEEPFLAALLTDIQTVHLFLAKGAGELRAVLRSLTPDLVAAHPRLRLMAALAHFKAGFFLEALHMLGAVKSETSGFTADPFGNDRALRIEGNLLELYFNVHVNPPESGAAIQAAVAAIRKSAFDDPLMWAATENLLIMFCEQSGDLEGAREAIQRTRSIYQTHNAVQHADASLLAHEVLLSLAEGRLQATVERADATRAAHAAGALGGVPLLAMARIAAGVVDYERKFHESAGDTVQSGLDQFGESEIWFEPHAVCYSVIVDVAWRRGGTDALKYSVASARRRALRTGLKDADDFLAALEAAYLIRAGEIDSARAAMATVKALHEGQERTRWHSFPWRLRDAVDIALALWLIASNETDRAAAHAQALIDSGSRGGRRRTAIKGHVLLALAHERAGEVSRAATAIEGALLLGSVEGHLAVFAEEGISMRGLLANIANGEGNRSPVARKAAAAVLRILTPPARAPNALNDREAQIVSLLITGASNKLIGRKLDLSENTIKFHLKKVFAKLGVTSRKAVVAAVRNV
ncbi:MAG: LuxR C-terminal-related transcriptional regulator [Gammaproteobacteria bacterium]